MTAGPDRVEAMIDFVDDDDRVVGSGTRQGALERGAGFRTSHVLVFTPGGKVLLQKVADGLKNAGWWGSSVAVHVAAGESSRAAAERGLAEELGIAASGSSPLDLRRVGNLSMQEGASMKFVSVFSLAWDGAVSVDLRRVAGVEVMDPDVVSALTEVRGSRSLTDTFKRAWALHRFVLASPAEARGREGP